MGSEGADTGPESWSLDLVAGTIVAVAGTTKTVVSKQ